MMATGQINVRIDAKTKAQAEAVLAKIGLAPSDAVRMLYRQLIMRRGLPFALEVIDAPSPQEKGRARLRKAVQESVSKNRMALKDLAGR